MFAGQSSILSTRKEAREMGLCESHDFVQLFPTFGGRILTTKCGALLPPCTLHPPTFLPSLVLERAKDKGENV